MKNLKKIPPVDEIMLDEDIISLVRRYNRNYVVISLRQVLDEVRTELKLNDEELDREVIRSMVKQRLLREIRKNSKGTLQRVINATGVVLHTNLGRAPLGSRALEYMQDMGKHYNNLEMNLSKGERGSRYVHVEELLVQITGAEAALVVNNNAAAVMLGLNTMAAGREVIVSRGQLIEIGGAFRIPEVMKMSGATLIEVGTTNKTYISDYEAAINENTALLFAAHTSNYKIVGFSEEVKLEEMVKLGKEKNLPSMQDLGSGILCDLSSWGLRDEPTVQQCVNAGADIITFSGDKLLGGPQAGIIVGKKNYIEAMKKNQLTRALRVDKLIISALEGTLLEYLCGIPERNIPVLQMLTINMDELEAKAIKLSSVLQDKFSQSDKIESIKYVQVEDMVGGGAYPTYRIPGFGVEIKLRENNLEWISQELRLMEPALLTRRQEDKMLISVRTLLAGDEEKLVEMLYEVLEKKGENL